MVRHDGLSPPKIVFRPFKWDPWIYVFEDDTGFVIPALYVDGILQLGANKQLLNKLKKPLVDHLDMIDMFDMSRVLSA